MTIDKPGIYPSVSAADYHADCVGPMPSLSSSIAKKLVSQSPAHAHYDHPRLGNHGKTDEDEAVEEKEKKEQARGTLIHRLLLGRGGDIVVCAFDSWRKDAAKAERDIAKAKGQIPTLPHLFAEAEAAANAARKQLDDLGLDYAYRQGANEVVIVWEEDGIWLRAMIDNLIISEDSRTADLRDLKTVGRTSHPEACASQIDKMGYDLSAAFYRRGIVALRPDLAGRIKFAWDFVETKPPYAVTPVFLSAEWEVAAEMKCQRAINRWRDCMKTGKWSFYTDKPVRLEPKPWQISDLMMQEDE